MLKFDEQEAERSEDFRVVPFGCAIGFNKTVDYDDVKDLYKVGGLCYYGSKAQ